MKKRAIKKTTFKCRYCKEKYTDEKMFQEHIAACTYDPRNRTCHTCAHNGNCNNNKMGYGVKIACLKWEQK